MASTTEDGAFQAHFEKNKLTLYLTKKGRRVLGVTFHETSSWCHEITWICTLIPDEYSPYINVKFLQQLSALREKFATHGRLTSIQIDRRMFVFRHETEDKAIEMLGSYTIIEEIILKFLRETGAQVTDITMKSEVDEAAASIDQETLPRGTTDQDLLFSSKHGDDVDAPHSHPQQRHDDIPHAQEDEEASHPHAQRDEDAAHLSTGSVTGMSGNSRADKSVSAGQINTNAINQDNRTVNRTIIINLPSGKAVCESCWKAKHENIPQPTDIDIETVKTLLNELFSDSLVRVRWECMVFCFEHESMEDAIGMIVQHADIKEDILHFLQELDPSIEDIVMEVEVRELCESEGQTAETSGSGPHSIGYGSGPHSIGYGSGPHSIGYGSGPLSIGYGSGPLSIGYVSESPSSGYVSESPSSGYVSESPSCERTSSDPSQGHSRSERDPFLSTASHATLSQADRDLGQRGREPGGGEAAPDYTGHQRQL